jgi:hypothetical protein
MTSLQQVGAHCIPHRTPPDIVNSGGRVKVGILLTAHKTVVMFMRYVHTQVGLVRQTAEQLKASTPWQGAAAACHSSSCP